MTPQTATRETVEHPGTTPRREGGVPRYRVFLGALLLSLAVLAALAAGGWGVVSSLAGEGPPARVGESVEVPGGAFRVENVTPEHMAPMQSKKFSQGGMSMSSMGMDMAPEGYERFAVEVTLAAEDGDLAYRAESFEISGPNVKPHGPVRSQPTTGDVPEGTALAGNLVFQAPEGAKNLTLRFGDSRQVALDVPAPENSGGHGH